MPFGILESMGEEDLRRYCEFLLTQYKAVDGFWFLCTSAAIGQETTERIVEEVWEKHARMAARDIVRTFAVHDKGLEGLMKALSFFPMATIVGYEMDREGGEMILTVPHCSAQEARLRHGQSEFVCKPMHLALFEAFAREIGPSITVECSFAPPDPHPKDLFCKWRFTTRNA